MKESDFIRQNTQKWQEFEEELKQKDADPSRTSKLFVQITDDLSYARTFYKNRTVRLYLNGVAKLLFNSLNKSSRKGWSDFTAFWKTDLPLSLYHSRRALLISFLVFVSCFILGVVTSRHDPDFARAILSSDYVNRTESNIEKGDPMAVYKDDPELETFLPILFNNLFVDFLTFFSGIFFAVGSLVVMISNGVMVGVFQYFFIERGLFWESFLTIWTHGALEIPTIILSGGAGLMLGKGLLFPGTFTRFQSFRLSGVHALKIIIGVVPVTFVAAFVEGFLTRHTELPDMARLGFILLSFAFILFYFFYYPRKVARMQELKGEEDEHTLIYKETIELEAGKILETGEIVSETLRLFFRMLIPFCRFLLPAVVCLVVLIAINPLDLFHFGSMAAFTFGNLIQFTDFPALGVAVLLLSSLLQFLLFWKLRIELFSDLSRERNIWVPFITVLLFNAIFATVVFLDFDFNMLVAFLSLPFLIFFSCVSVLTGKAPGGAINYGWSLLRESWSRFLLGGLIFTLMGLLTMIAFYYGMRVLFIRDALVWALTDDEETGDKIQLGFFAFQIVLAYCFYLMLLGISSCVLFFTLEETLSAKHLISRIKNIRATK